MTQPIHIERLLNAPAEKAWRAITDHNEMKNWYFQLEDFKPEKGFRFEFMGGSEEGQYKHLCEVTEVIPGKKITYSWRYDGYPGNSFVTWQLEDRGPQTLLTLTHTGVESFSANGKDFQVESFTAGWDYIVNTGLAGYLEKV